MNANGQQWWQCVALRPAWWLLDRALDGLFVIWDRLDDPERKWGHK